METSLIIGFGCLRHPPPGALPGGEGVGRWGRGGVVHAGRGLKRRGAAGEVEVGGVVGG